MHVVVGRCEVVVALGMADAVDGWSHIRFCRWLEIGRDGRLVLLRLFAGRGWTREPGQLPGA